MQRPSALLVLSAMTILASDILSAQQHPDWPLCGILAIDSLGIRPKVLVRSGRDEALGKALPQLTAWLQATMERVLSPLLPADSPTVERGSRGSQEATLLLQLGISRPRGKVAAVGGTWLLLVGLQPSWQRSGPLQIISSDSIIDGAQREGIRLIEELPTKLQQCRQISEMRLNLN